MVQDPSCQSCHIHYKIAQKKFSRALSGASRTTTDHWKKKEGLKVSGVLH
jgi:hypothetical protein